ncbi:hypothetical protein M758_6G046600 [Ceratodon purpureus]|nr:hypothetical protein M758_6G046600 [Ceratodon purpureus]
MHCGRVPCGLGSCSSGLAREASSVHDGGPGSFVSAHGTAMAMAMSRGKDVSVSRRAVRRVVCEGSSSSRRVSYKRRQQPPSKGFPISHEPDVFDAHKTQQDLQKTRAFEFLCESDEASTSDGPFHLPHNLVDDGSWSSRILTQIQVDLMWLSLHSSSFRLDHLLRSALHPVPRRGRRSKRSRKGTFEYQDSKGRSSSGRHGQEGRVAYNDSSEGSRGAQALAVAVDLREQEVVERRFRSPAKLQMLADQAVHAIGNLDFFQWLERLKETYGASFMVLVVLGYCTQGFRCFPWLAMSYYFKDNLQVDPGTMQFLMSTTMLPMLAKPVYGIISDSVYIKGAHRIPYLMIAGALQFVAWGAIVMHPGASSSVAVLTGVLTMSNMGAAISEVMNDALVAEAVKSKQGARQGELQSLAWLALATGGLFGNLMGGFALQRMDTTTMFSIFMILVGTHLLLCTTISEATFGLGQSSQGSSHTEPLTPMRISPQEKAVLLPQMTKRIYSRFGYTADSGVLNRVTLPTPINSSQSSNRVVDHVECLNLSEIPENHPKPLGIQGQLALLSDMLQKPAVLRPLLWFLSSYAVIPNLGSSMFFYQTQHLGLDSSVIGLVKVVGQTGLLAGSMIYNRKLKKVPLRKLFGGIQVLMSLCMLSDIVLVNRVNLQIGIPDEFFVLGASAFVEAIAQFKILPFMVLLAQLCPAGSEGSLLAFFMSAQCLAGLTSAYLGVGLASCLHISSNSFDELPLGILIQAGFALLPVLWINFIPEEQADSTSSTNDSTSRQLLPSATTKDTTL